MPTFDDDRALVLREVNRRLERIAEDPGDLRRVLEGLARVLELLSSLIPRAVQGRGRLEWREEPQEPQEDVPPE